jgi:phosphate transport system permease protein
MNVETRIPTDWKSDVMQKRIKRRYAAERRFRFIGLGAILVSAGFLAFLLISMLGGGLGGFTRAEVDLPVDFPAAAISIDPAVLKGPQAPQALAAANLPLVTTRAAEAAFGDKGELLLSPVAWLSLRDAIMDDPSILRRKAVLSVPASAQIDLDRKSVV